jgi:hypothetical protein
MSTTTSKSKRASKEPTIKETSEDKGKPANNNNNNNPSTTTTTSTTNTTNTGGTVSSTADLENVFIRLLRQHARTVRDRHNELSC